MIPTNASVNGPLDTALAEVTVLSMDNRIASLRIEKIQDYIRYPNAKYAQLKVSDVINVKIYDFVASSFDPTVGKKYLANMSLCITNYYGGLSCQYDGWSAALYPENTDQTANWKTYQNEEYGFEVKYPNHWTFSEHSTGGNDIGIRFDSSKTIQEGCDINARGDVGDNPFACPGNGFDINVNTGLTRDKYIDNFKGSKLIVSQVKDIIISGKKFTKITFANYGPQYIIEDNGRLLSFSSDGSYDRTDQIILSTFKFISQ